MEIPLAWERFREEVFPRHVSIIRQLVGREIPVEVDWVSLGDDGRLAENLGYDLEMIGRGLEGVDAHSPFVDEAEKVDGSLLVTGIDAIRIRRVERPEECRLVVVDGTLHVDFLWTGTGSFSAREVESLLLDREGDRVRRWTTPEDPELAPRLDEVRRNRLPSLLRGVHEALGDPLPVHLDWEGLDGSPDAPVRLVTMMGHLAGALRTLTRKDPGMVVGPEEVHDRARREAEEQSGTVRDGIREVRISGGSVRESPVCSVSEGRLGLVVFQDTEYVPAGRDGPPRPVQHFSHLPGAGAGDIEKILLDHFDLELGPLRRRVQNIEHPKAQLYLDSYLEGLVGEFGGSGLRKKLDLRKLLEEGGVDLEVDWESLAEPGSVDDRRACLRKLETGQYNYNCDYGDLFQALIFALEEAFRRSESFPGSFLRQVRAVRYVHVPEARDREVVADGETLVLRQCLLESGGEFGDPTDLASRLIAVVESMSVTVVSTGDDPIGAGLRQIESALGAGVTVSIDRHLRSGELEPLLARVVRPLLGAIALLLDEAGPAEEIKNLVMELRLEQAGAGEKPGCVLQGATLLYRCSPGEGASGRLAGEDLRRALDDAVGLRVRGEIRRLEREGRPTWDRMLRERFDRELPVRVDWETFLAHPTGGGNRLYPLYVIEAGVMRLIYALNGWMDEDASFRGRARRLIRELVVTSAPDADAADLVPDGPAIVYHCHADMSMRGFLTIDDLQMRLGRLVF